MACKKFALQLWADLGRENYSYVNLNCQYSFFLEPTPSWRIYRTYRPFSDRQPVLSATVARICMRRPLPRITKTPVCRIAIQALHPIADQLESGNCLQMWDIDCRTYRLFSDRQPILSVTVARICMCRPLSRITKTSVFRIAIKALRPIADQLESGNCLQMRDIDCRTYRPFSDRQPILSATVARICMRRPLPRITKTPVCRIAIQALRPIADQLESGNRLQMWDIDCRTYRPFSDRQPILFAAVARISMRRPLP